MQYVNLGNSGLKISRLTLGMMTYGDAKWRKWILDERATLPFVREALDLGINCFDTGNFYSHGESEVVTGRILKKLVKREEIILGTKVYIATGDKPNMGGLSRKHILKAIDDSLIRLDTDYVDLYQIQRWDWDTPIEETLETLNLLIRSGKVRYITASSMFAWQFAKAYYTAQQRNLSPFIAVSSQYNLIFREEEREMYPFCQDIGIGLMPWSPLARGFLAGKTSKEGTLRSQYDKYKHNLYGAESDLIILERVHEVASKRGVSPAEISLAWILSKPQVCSPVIGATQLKHLEDAADAIYIDLSEEETAYLEEPYVPHEICVTLGMHNEFKELAPE